MKAAIPFKISNCLSIYSYFNESTKIDFFFYLSSSQSCKLIIINNYLGMISFYHWKYIDTFGASLSKNSLCSLYPARISSFLDFSALMVVSLRLISLIMTSFYLLYLLMLSALYSASILYCLFYSKYLEKFS